MISLVLSQQGINKKIKTRKLKPREEANEKMGFKGTGCVETPFSCWFAPISWLSEWDKLGWVWGHGGPQRNTERGAAMWVGVAATQGGPGDDFSAVVRASSCILAVV